MASMIRYESFDVTAGLGTQPAGFGTLLVGRVLAGGAARPLEYFVCACVGTDAKGARAIVMQATSQQTVAAESLRGRVISKTPYSQKSDFLCRTKWLSAFLGQY